MIFTYCYYICTMHKLYFTIISLIFFSLNSCTKREETSPPAPTSQPNILLIIADDLGLDAVPAYEVGSSKAKMPHLQNIANNGITFDNAWSYPVCSPTRASILTGRYGLKTGVLNVKEAATINSSEKTIQAYLDEQLGKVYSHALIGKWHLSNNQPNKPNDMGIDYCAGLLSGSISDYNDWTLTENGRQSQSTDYITTKITNLAIDWIRKQKQPWFCWLAYTAPHSPFHLPPSNMHSQGNLPSDQASIEANSLPYYLSMALKKLYFLV